ncbi:hypothetical protein N7447_002526 [Penicillium robsamsonii]|uniref:uncharacterized protein n=1 Tax=Penicillium robsamsonii TaxID=1792511 RepID=UPI0025497D4F|nr:uncharacterized protein N7447_002526 [Penicillium robsamsonii]KAJ5836500.1 hypothetical protein N7447_002526 [Penicillium robsamsonii]
MKLDRAKPQVSALQSLNAAQRRTTKFVDQEQMDALISQSRGSRSRDVDAQLRVLSIGWTKPPKSSNARRAT